MTSDQQEHSGSVGGSTPAVTYAFTDGSGNTLRLTSITTPSGIQTNRAYGIAGSIDDVFNRPASLQVQGEANNLVEYQYAGLSLTAKTLYPAPNSELSYLATAASGTGDGGDSLTGYDRFNRIIKMPWKNKTNNTFLAQICYGYDAASRRKWRQDLTPATEREQDRFYTYDHLSQVKSAAVGTLNENRTAIGGIPIQGESWNYDETGNWLAYQKAADGTTTVDETRRNNQSNQIKTIDDSSTWIAHDLNGNTTLLPTGDGRQGPSRILKWDAWNRLVEVRNAADNSFVARYAYDGLFRRITASDAATTVTHSYYNRQWRVLEERKDTSVNPSQVFYWGARSRGELIRRDRDTVSSGALDEAIYCLIDAMDPIAIVNASGIVVERYDYTAFGITGFLAPDYSARVDSNFDWNFLFHGEFRDVDTGMFNYGFRNYDPQSGRWLSRDPIGEDGGVNLYRFVGNDVLNWLDNFGKNPTYGSKDQYLDKWKKDHPNHTEKDLDTAAKNFDRGCVGIVCNALGKGDEEMPSLANCYEKREDAVKKMGEMDAKDPECCAVLFSVKGNDNDPKDYGPNDPGQNESNPVDLSTWDTSPGTGANFDFAHQYKPGVMMGSTGGQGQAVFSTNDYWEKEYMGKDFNFLVWCVECKKK